MSQAAASSTTDGLRLRLTFEGGTILVEGLPEGDRFGVPHLKRDPRTGKLYRGHIFYEDKWAMWKVDLDPGPQVLDGEKAHGYVRFRYDREGDPGRIRRQQLVLKAIAKKMMEKPLFQLPDLAKQIRRGRYFGDGLLLTHVLADLSVKSDGTGWSMPAASRSALTFCGMRRAAISPSASRRAGFAPRYSARAFG